MKYKLTKTSFYILSFTWGLPLTLVGLLVSFVMIITGHKPQKYGWTWYFDAGENWGGSEFGICFVKAHDEGESICRHEFGHGIQNCIYGPFTPIVVNLPSSARYWYRRIARRFGKKFKRGYYDVWFEKEADVLGEYYRENIMKEQ